MEAFVLIAVGALIGCAFYSFITRGTRVGYLWVDDSDPDDGPHLFLQANKDVKTISRMKYAKVAIRILRPRK